MKKWYEEKNAPADGAFLCKADELSIGDVKEFEFGDSAKNKFRLFVYRGKDKHYAYVNRCPHFNVPLNVNSGELFNADKSQFQCCHHYATFEIETGVCTDGPCEGRALTPIDLQTTGNKINVVYIQ